MKLVTTKKAIKEYLKEILSTSDFGWATTGDVSNVSVSPIVDPLAAITDPGNENFTPQNRAELKIAITSILDGVEDNSASKAYNTVKDAVENMKDEEEMSDDKKVESIIRNTIKQILREKWEKDPKTGAEVWRDESSKKAKAKPSAGPVVGELPAVTKIPSGEHGGEFKKKIEKYTGDVRKSLKTWDDSSVEDAVDSDAPAAGRTRKNVMMTDVGGTSFKDMARDLGFASESGAKQAVERIMAKAQFVHGLPDEEQQILTLTAMKDYIDELLETDAISQEDAELMRQNPTIVSDLDSFRVYLSKYIKKAMKA